MAQRFNPVIRLWLWYVYWTDLVLLKLEPLYQWLASDVTIRGMRMTRIVAIEYHLMWVLEFIVLGWAMIHAMVNEPADHIIIPWKLIIIPVLFGLNMYMILREDQKLR